MRKLKLIFLFLLTLPTSSVSWAESFTDGKPFIPWVFEDQVMPTVKRSYDYTGLSILAAGFASASIAHQYDDRVRDHNVDPNRRIFSSETANFGGYIGNGAPSIAIAIAQLAFDRENGLQLSRAIALTAASHITLATMIQRERPNGQNNLSMPSGHASSAFATATSLAYSYGWTVGVPAYLAASFISATRVSENIHWTSDVVAAAALGIYWGRASALVTEDRKSSQEVMVVPVMLDDGGAMLSVRWDF